MCKGCKALLCIISSRDERVQHYLYLYLYMEWVGPNLDVGGACLEMVGALNGMLF